MEFFTSFGILLAGIGILLACIGIFIWLLAKADVEKKQVKGEEVAR